MTWRHLKVGDAVETKHLHSRGDPLIFEGVVTKVGTRWVYVERRGTKHHVQRFDRDTGAIDRGDYSPNTFLTSPEHRAEEEQRSNAETKIRKHLFMHGWWTGGGVSTDKLVRIVAILEEP